MCSLFLLLQTCPVSVSIWVRDANLGETRAGHSLGSVSWFFMCQHTRRKIAPQLGSVCANTPGGILFVNTNQGTQDESQWIVAQGCSHHLQYLDSIESFAKDLSQPLLDNMIIHKSFHNSVAYTQQINHSACHVAKEVVDNTAYPAWIPT